MTTKKTLKKDLSSPRWKHTVPTIPKGTIVEYNEKDKTVKHPTMDGVSIMIDSEEKYFEK
jgi:hypothetical protein